jgi:hypothetical protein
MHEAEWTPFQAHYFSENVVAPGIELGPLDLEPGTLTNRLQRRLDTSFRKESCSLHTLYPKRV